MPIEDTFGAVDDMVKAGYMKHIGLSEMGSDTIRRASAVHRIKTIIKGDFKSFSPRFVGENLQKIWTP